MIKTIFTYISHLWHGTDGKPSTPKVLAIAFSIHFMIVFHNSEEGPLWVSAGLIAGCLGIRAYTAAQNTRETETTKRAKVTKTSKSLDEDVRPDIEPGPQE